MKITLTTGTGTGHTLLSAFDSALQDCGVSNYNLLMLSSVIPPLAELVCEKYVTPDSEYGNRLYVVKADKRSDKKGEWVGAAIGWYQRKDNGGVFVEHTAAGKTKEDVEKILHSDVLKSIMDLCKFRDYPCTEQDVNMKMQVTRVNEHPTCALVLAVYKSENW